MSELVRRRDAGSPARPGGSHRAALTDDRCSVALTYSAASPKLADLEGLMALIGQAPVLDGLGSIRGSVGTEPRVRRNKATGDCREEGVCLVVGESGVARFVVSRPVQVREAGGRTVAKATGPWVAAQDGLWAVRNPKQTAIASAPAATQAGGSSAGADAAANLDPAEEFLALPEQARTLIEGRVPFGTADTAINRAIHYSDGTEHLTTLRIGVGRVVLAVAVRPHDGLSGAGPFTVNLFTGDLTTVGQLDSGRSTGGRVGRPNERPAVGG
ncbi:hypothetical protein DVS28_b0500 (plasmid) [Euzebya pacifica]|uniref:Uncharacterized protein n=1 Tax=Euzebya pacifica TaxID=1608957 RepID=A0A346Y6Z3_9ACTN|nr:hypothetical protein [Euzebya pacifica]AXV10240.1 hypothetical protein DVS28_b0500 [Euzebya pacifica]